MPCELTSITALRQPAYRWAFLAHVLLILAAQVQATAFGWLIYERTHSAVALGLTGLAAFLWSLRAGQYDDIEGAALRVLDDGDLS